MGGPGGSIEKRIGGRRRKGDKGETKKRKKRKASKQSYTETLYL